MNQATRNLFYQHTLTQPLHFVGRGLHSGKPVSMSLLPSVADSGYLFERLDVIANSATVPARWHTVTETRLSTTVANSYGVKVASIEHLLAALHIAGVDNCRILLDGPEVPVMDGSAKPFLVAIQHGGITQQLAERRALVITKPIWRYENASYAGFLPFPHQWVDMTINFDNPVIGKQNYSTPINESLFSCQIAEARTFGFEDQLETMRKLGLAQGGSLRNAILVGEEGVINEEGLRFEDEFVRHKILDVVGDLALAGAVIMGRFVGHCSGHSLNNRLLRGAMLREDIWHYTTLREATEQWCQLIDDSSYVDLLNHHRG